MLAVNPERRITAIDALMHDFCIANKTNYLDDIHKLSFTVPSAEEFLSCYSMDFKNNKGSMSFSFSHGSINRSNMLSFALLNTSKNDSKLSQSQMAKKESSSTNDLSLKEIHKDDSLSSRAFAMMFNQDLCEDHSVIQNNSAVPKKSKFAN